LKLLKSQRGNHVVHVGFSIYFSMKKTTILTLNQLDPAINPKAIPVDPSLEPLKKEPGKPMPKTIPFRDLSLEQLKPGDYGYPVVFRSVSPYTPDNMLYDEHTHAHMRRLGYSWDLANHISYRGLQSKKPPLRQFAMAEDRRHTSMPPGIDEQISMYRRRHNELPNGRGPCGEACGVDSNEWFRDPFATEDGMSNEEMEAAGCVFKFE
jgi:hypothetical protein